MKSDNERTRRVYALKTDKLVPELVKYTWPHGSVATPSGWPLVPATSVVTRPDDETLRNA